MRLHLIEGGVVANTIEAASADAIPGALLVPADAGGQIGDVWDGEAFAPGLASRRITRLAFRNRFTPVEKAALYTAAESSVQVRVYLDDVNAAAFVDLGRPDTVAGVQALEAAALIGPGRAAEILGADIGDDEAWQK